MQKIPKLGQTVSRFNQGCAFYKRAFKAFQDGKADEYELSLRTSATETIGALEWILKIHLRHVRRAFIQPIDMESLKQPNFDTLIGLMKSYGDPKLDEKEISLLYEYRSMLRNTAEHDASIPSSKDLYDAIEKIRELILRYLPVDEGDLLSVEQPKGTELQIQELRDNYFEYLRNMYQYMDLGGISPRVGSKVVKIKLDDLFVSVDSIEETKLTMVEEEEVYFSLEEALDEPDFQPVDLESSMDEEEISEFIYEHKDKRNSIQRILANPRLVILGHPGAGKSTISKYIAYSIASGNFNVTGEGLRNYIPVLFRAVDYSLSLKVEPNLSIADFLIQKKFKQYDKLISWSLNNKRCLTIIDGLDEIPEPQLRTLIIRQIEQFISEYIDNRFLITSRIVGYSQNPLSGDFMQVTLTDLDEGKILLFLRKWHQAVESETNNIDSTEKANRQAEELMNSINKNPGIRKLSGNPLLLTIIALANWRGTKLPNKRVELYQIATETLLENWPLKQRGVSLDLEEVLAILEPIAFRIHDEGFNGAITEHDFKPLFESQVMEVRGVGIAEARRISREIQKTIEIDTGFFLQKGYDENGQKVYGFLHQTFGEYLCARYFAEKWSSREFDLQKYLHNPRWHEVILLMAGHVGTWALAQASNLVSDIFKASSPYEEHIHRDLFLASEIICDNVRVKREVQDAILVNLAKIVITTKNWKLLSEALNKIKHISQVFPIDIGELSKALPALANSKRFPLLKLFVGDSSPKTVNDYLLTLENSGDNYYSNMLLPQALGIQDEVFRFDHEAALVIQSDNSAHFLRVDNTVIERIKPFGFKTIETINRDIKKKPKFEIWLVRKDEIKEFNANSLLTYIRGFKSPYSKRNFLTTISNFSDEAYRLAQDLINIAANNSTENILDCIQTVDNLIERSPYHIPSKKKFLEMGQALSSILLNSDDLIVKEYCLRLISKILDRNNFDQLFAQVINENDERFWLKVYELCIYRNIKSGVLAKKAKSDLIDGSLAIQKSAAIYLIGNNIKDAKLNEILLDRCSAFTETGFVDSSDIHFILRKLIVLFFDWPKEFHSKILNSIYKIANQIGDDEDTAYWLLNRYENFPRKTKEIDIDVSEFLKNEKPSVRVIGIVIWNITHRNGNLPLVVTSLLDDPNPIVRQAVINALPLSFIKKNAHAIIECVKDTHKISLEAAINKIRRSENEDLLNIIADDLNNILKLDPDNEEALNALLSTQEEEEDIPF